MKNRILIAGTATAIGLSGVAGIGAVSAQNDSATGDPMSGLVDKLVSKFNLDKEEVQSVFNEAREEHEAQREKQQGEHLQALVDDGTITEAQKTAIEAKIKEMKEEREANKDSFKDLSGDERRAKMEEKRTELESWAQEQGLDLSKLRGILMGGRGPGGPPVE